MTVFVSTVGTSIAGRPFYQQGMGDDDYRDQIEAKLSNAKRRAQSGDLEWPYSASAEVNGLARGGCQKGDRVVLLATETTDGRLCAERLADLLRELFDCSPDVRVIPGLQVTDGRRFAREGVTKLFAAMDSVREANGRESIVINVTGGFKGTVPFVTVYGLLYGIPVQYTYEMTDTLITLPALPLFFDWDRLAEVGPLLRAIEEEGVLSLHEFDARRRGAGLADADWVDAFFDRDETGVTTSGLADALVERVGDAAPSRVLLSPSARAILEAAEGYAAVVFGRMLHRIADPLWRMSHKHNERYHTTDLVGCKPRDGQRLLYWVDDGAVHVAELFPNHDTYETWLKSPLRRKSYDVDRFEPWRAPETPDDLQDEDSGVAALREQIEDWRARASAKERELAEARHEVNKERRRRHDLAAELGRLRSAAQEMADLRERLEHAEAARTLTEQQLAALKEEIERRNTGA